MRNTDHIDFVPGGREERFAEITDAWPYVLETAELDRYPQRTCSWHWHREVELFYVERGQVEYRVRAVHRRMLFPEGSAGFLNCGFLHMTTAPEEGAVQRLHIFRPELLGDVGGRISRRFVEPLVANRQADVLAWLPDRAEDRAFIELVRASFQNEGVAAGDELATRAVLSEIWAGVLARAEERSGHSAAFLMTERDVRCEQMIGCIRDRYAEALRVGDIASAAACSERDCFRTFQACLGMTPMRYLKEYRIEQSCRLLSYTTRPVRAVAQQCGFSTASQFGLAFRSIMGCTPSQYRSRWQDQDSPRRDERSRLAGARVCCP